MKKLLYIALICLSACTQERREAAPEQKCTKDSLAIEADLLPYFEAFIEDCELRGINSDHAYCLEYIHLGHPRGCQGITDLENGTIEINEHLSEDKVGTKFVVYHELGHWFGLGHASGRNIMKVSYDSYKDSAMVAENWDELMDDFFNEIKNTQDDNYNN
jgi:Zn-dependent peptidase ImmA (M78 family)